MVSKLNHSHPQKDIINSHEADGDLEGEQAIRYIPWEKPFGRLHLKKKAKSFWIKPKTDMNNKQVRKIMVKD